MKDVAVGAGGLHLVEVAGVGDLLAVGRERVLVLPAETEGRHLVRAGRQVARDAAIGTRRGTGGCTCRRSKWFQWRNISWVKILAFTFDLACSSSRCLLQASSLQSG